MVKSRSKKNNIVPLGDRVLIKPVSDEEHKKTESGIIIPETVEKERPEVGKVIAVGKGRINDDGSVVPMKVKVGDTVLFSKFGPDEVKVEGEEYLIVSEGNILATIK